MDDDRFGNQRGKIIEKTDVKTDMARSLFDGIADRIGAYTNFNADANGKPTITPQTLRFVVLPREGVSFLVEGMTDIREDEHGELTRGQVREEVRPGEYGEMAIPLEPGSYVIKQTAAPDGYLINERMIMVQVGSGGYMIDNQPCGGDAMRFAILPLERACGAVIVDSAGTPHCGKVVYAVGEAYDSLAGGMQRFVTHGRTNSDGTVEFMLPVGQFVLYDESPPYAVMGEIAVASGGGAAYAPNAQDAPITV